ncbi:MAG: hypothetical protein R6V35_04705 [Candidatus Nanohaloarchaea archaeon]
MPMKVEEKVDAEFIDEWENGFGWIARPEEDMVRTSHAFEDNGVFLVDPLDAENLDEKLEDYGEVKGIIVLFDRHQRDSEQLAEKYGCPIYVPEWLEPEIKLDAEPIENKIPGTSWELIETVNTLTGREAGLYNKQTGTIIVADALGTVDFFKGRNEKLGLNPLYRLNPPKNLLNYDIDRIFCGHGIGIQENTKKTLKNTLDKARRKAPSAYFNAVKSMI